jgi:hypothetical protein
MTPPPILSLQMGVQLLPFTLFQSYFENAAEWRSDTIISLQRAVGLDLIVAQAAAPVGTEDAVP